MSIESEPSQKITLEEKEIYSFKDRKQVFISRGVLWMTLEGDSEDYFFREGDSFDVPDGRHAVVQALGKTHFWF